MAIELIDTIKPKNNGRFPIVEAEDVLMPDGKRLDEYEFSPSTEGSEEITVTVDVLPETTYEGFALDSGLGIYGTGHPATFELTIGQVYKVNWDGNDYSCTAYAFETSGGAGVAIGNEGILTGTSSEVVEPFAIMYVTSTGYNSFFALDGSTAVSHTVRIYQTTTTVIQISTAVPPVSAADNGKIYQVVDGKMAAVSLGDSAVKTYIDDYINEALGGDY